MTGRELSALRGRCKVVGGSKTPAALALAVAVVIGACKKSESREVPERTTAQAPEVASSAAASAPAPPAAQARSDPFVVDSSRYGWLGDPSREVPRPVIDLEARFPTPASYSRVSVEPGSFGEWLRHLPIAAPDTPVETHKGDVVLPGDHPYVAAVVAIDIGNNDLQAGPDLAIRLHAEWLWSKKALDAMSYRGPNRTDMPFSKFLRGERIVARPGGDVESVLLAKPTAEPVHTHLRDYLDSVFNWVNSRALFAQAKPVSPADLRPGDFFVHDGKPGDAVVVLDVATDRAHGRTLLMLAQGLSPAQNVIVVSPGGRIAWFEVNPPTPLVTPHTDVFAWDNLRRL